jgi:hypothetical protein
MMKFYFETYLRTKWRQVDGFPSMKIVVLGSAPSCSIRKFAILMFSVFKGKRRTDPEMDSVMDPEPEPEMDRSMIPLTLLFTLARIALT